MELTETRRPDTDAVMETAARAMQALTEATHGKEVEASAGTTVGTLRQLNDLIGSLTAQLTVSIAIQREQTQALDRIASLKIRSAQQRFESGDWKSVTAELQSIATDMLGRSRIR